MGTRNVTLTECQEETLTRLCSDMIGTTLGAEEPLTPDELIAWHLISYLEGKCKMYADVDAQSLTPEEVAAALAAREEE